MTAEIAFSQTQQLSSFLRDSFKQLELDLKEEGNQCTLAKQANEVTVKIAWKKGRGSEVPCYNGAAVLPCTPRQLLEKCLIDLKGVKAWGPVDDIQVIETVKLDTEDVPVVELFLQKHPPFAGGLVSPRDYCLCRSWRFFPSADGKEEAMRFVTASVLDDRVPEVPEFVRGCMYFGAWSADPLPDGKCLAHYIFQTNINGSVPLFLLKPAVVKEVADTFPKIRKYFGC